MDDDRVTITITVDKSKTKIVAHGSISKTEIIGTLVIAQDILIRDRSEDDHDVQDDTAQDAHAK